MWPSMSQAPHNDTQRDGVTSMLNTPDTANEMINWVSVDKYNHHCSSHRRDCLAPCCCAKSLAATAAAAALA